jgi:hypothetical protein
MNTYLVLRSIDHLRTSIDNLFHEAERFYPNVSMGSGEVKSVEKDVSVTGLIGEEIRRIDEISMWLSMNTETKRGSICITK